MIIHNRHIRAARTAGPDTAPGVEGLDWMGHPARGCADPANAELFYGESSAERHMAERICRSCPFLHACDTYATANNEKFGVWGGRDRKEPERVRVQIRNRAKPGLAADSTDEEVVESVLGSRSGQFTKIDRRLQQLVVDEGLRRMTLGHLAHKLTQKASVLYGLMHDHTLDERLRELFEQGYTDQEIGDELGLTKGSAAVFRKAAGLIRTAVAA